MNEHSYCQIKLYLQKQQFRFGLWAVVCSTRKICSKLWISLHRKRGNSKNKILLGRYLGIFLLIPLILQNILSNCVKINKKTDL